MPLSGAVPTAWADWDHPLLAPCENGRVDRSGRELRESLPSADQAEVAYRGFLFSDLRRYTAFVERHGNQAAAELLDAYRGLVRAEVARQRGSEIRTEGDSFYVAFPSAQRAVACGLDIVAAADRHNQAHPGLPISVGVGIHAGETIERPDGYIGSAVNLAARVCAQARTGEVLVTGTVRELTRSGSPLTFTARGSHRLKGVTETVALFAAHRADSIAIAVRHPRALLLAPVVLIAAIVLGWIALNVARPGDSHASSPSPDANAAPSLISASPSASVEPSSGAFPTDAEARLLARLDDDVARHCQRADPEDAPVLDEGSRDVVTPLIHNAGLECQLGSLSEPDSVWYWQAVPGQRLEQVSSIFLQAVGRRLIPPGDCATDDFAYGRWEFGPSQGGLLCYGSRNATLVWTYEDESILASAIRSDGDMRALYRWWRDHRLLGTPGS